MVGSSVGKYRVLCRLGRGGMGTVYKAVDETLDREVALKCLNADLGDPELLKRFRAEAMTLARLNHPNIATLFELTEHDGALMMVMEFVRGETLDKVAMQAGPMGVDQTAQLCSQVLDALAHAHRAGVVHRDLKPANLMLTETGMVKVMDFGLARMAGTEHLTNDGYMVGTPAYMAPEQVMGLEIDGRTDLYAMGVVLFRLLTSQLPFQANSGIAMAQKQITDPPTPLRQLRTELSAEIEAMLERALAKAPADRYQTADEFKAALSAATGVASLIAPIPSVITRAPVVAVEEPPLTVALPRVSLSGTQLMLSLSPMPPAAVPPAPAVSRLRRMAAAVAVGGVLLAGLPTLMLWRGRTPPPEPAAAHAPAAVAPLSPGSRPAPAAPATAAIASASVNTSSVRRSLPLVTFSKIKLLMLNGGKSRDASLRFEPDGMMVVDGGTTIERAAYGDITGIFHAHAREPRWAAADGTAVPIGKTSTRFGFLKGVPDWVTVRTRKLFIPLRVQNDALGRVIAEFEARTGTKVIRTR